MRKLTFCVCENKGADQRRDNREADQRLLFSLQDVLMRANGVHTQYLLLVYQQAFIVIK